jgi:hypothetical protein
MHKHIRKAFLLALPIVMLLILSVTTDYAMAATAPDASGSNPVSVIEKMVNAMNNQDAVEYTSTFTQTNRVDMEKAYSNSSGEPFFQEKSAQLVNIKKLPADVGIIAAAISPREELGAETEVYYTQLALKVDKEDKWLYNGINHRVIVMVNENGEWKISRMSVPDMACIVEKGQGFGTKAEEQALRIENTMEKKGIVLNMQGAIVKNIAASQAELGV